MIMHSATENGIKFVSIAIMPRKNELTYLLKKFENGSENSETIQMTSETSANAKNTNDAAGQYSFMVFFSFSISIKPETGSFHIFSLTRLTSGKNAPASRAISAGSDESITSGDEPRQTSSLTAWSAWRLIIPSASVGKLSAVP